MTWLDGDATAAEIAADIRKHAWSWAECFVEKVPRAERSFDEGVVYGLLRAATIALDSDLAVDRPGFLGAVAFTEAVRVLRKVRS